MIVPDLRGYGDSSKPPDGESHVNYSKRAMALDQVEVMKHFGFDRFPVIGQDRGGRVGHRLALDHPDKVTGLAVLDIVPTYYHYTHVTLEFVQAYFHWFNYLRPAPGPENDLKAQTEAQLARATSEVQKEYLRTASQPENIHGMCEDYRAGASIDFKHDEADLNKKIACPVLALWSDARTDRPAVRRARHLEGARDDRDRQGPGRRPLPAGGRRRSGGRGTAAPPARLSRTGSIPVRASPLHYRCAGSRDSSTWMARRPTPACSGR